MTHPSIVVVSGVCSKQRWTNVPVWSCFEDEMLLFVASRCHTVVIRKRGCPIRKELNSSTRTTSKKSSEKSHSRCNLQSAVRSMRNMLYEIKATFKNHSLERDRKVQSTTKNYKSQWKISQIYKTLTNCVPLRPDATPPLPSLFLSRLIV